MDDKLLRQLIIDELDFDPSIDAANVGVTVDNGIVTLSGHVASYSERHDAEQAAKRIKGVRAVVEEIKVRLPFDAPPKDEDIARRATNVLDWNTLVPKEKVQVKVEGGWVTLTGTVEWQYQRNEAATSVKRLSGILGVTNLIEVKPSGDARETRDVKAKIEAALKRNAEMEAGAIRVTVKDHKVTLDGKVKAWYERGLAENAAWSAPGIRQVEDRLTLA